ncbi:MAG: SEC-C metal-binding domain-containing protein [Candidatus Binatia bacterium]
MAKVGRNQSCPCGSGKKYKRCCLPQDEARASGELRAAAADSAAAAAVNYAARDDDDDLDEVSNAVVDLIRAGRLDEAEAAARDLLVRYPEVFDGLERLAMVYEARGDRKQAADYYRQAARFILENPDGFDGEIPTSLIEQANDLDPLPS